ncbi:MAG: ABC transporter substrate-binding protein [Stenomitos rutilans HA7619-LM2]|nr:ABC transporter substrate-binding protein [Stenomitos rutilans HA7619-LM2]
MVLRRWRTLWLVAAFVSAIALTNCTGGNQETSSTSGGTSPSAPSSALVYGSVGQPVNLEPGNITDGNSIIVQDQLYDRLITFKPGTTDLEPSLATAWSVADGTTWTFKLRAGIKFHDGTAFDADAVKFNVERWWDPQHPQGYRDAGKLYEIWGALFGGFKGSPNSLLQSVTVIDPTTVQFKLKQPFAGFPNAIASGFFGIASPTAIKKAGARYGTPSTLAVGTGPFVFKEWRTGDRIVLEKNSTYWRAGFPKVNQVVIRFITDPAARLAQLRAGQIDFTVDLAPDQKKEVESDPDLDTVLRPSFNVGFLALNPGYKPLSNVRVRQAIAYALNRPAIVKAFWGDLGQSDAHFTPPTLAWSQDSTLVAYPFDPTKARQLLAEAGYPNGFNLDLWYPPPRPYYPTPKPIAEAFAADLSAIGIRVSLQTKDWAAYQADRLKSPGYQSFMLGWTGDYGDPDNFLYYHFGANSTADLGNWKNDQLFQRLDQARKTSDQAARAKLYAQVDAVLHREVLRLPIVHSQPLLAKRKTIDGWTPSPLGSEPFDAIIKKR